MLTGRILIQSTDIYQEWQALASQTLKHTDAEAVVVLPVKEAISAGTQQDEKYASNNAYWYHMWRQDYPDAHMHILDRSEK